MQQSSFDTPCVWQGLETLNSPVLFIVDSKIHIGLIKMCLISAFNLNWLAKMLNC